MKNNEQLTVSLVLTWTIFSLTKIGLHCRIANNFRSRWTRSTELRPFKFTADLTVVWRPLPIMRSGLETPIPWRQKALAPDIRPMGCVGQTVGRDQGENVVTFFMFHHHGVLSIHMSLALYRRRYFSNRNTLSCTYAFLYIPVYFTRLIKTL